jgi:hypothetical protein
MPTWASAACTRKAPRFGFCWRRLTASMAFRSTLRTPGGRPWGLSCSPSGPSSTQRFRTRWTVDTCVPCEVARYGLGAPAFGVQRDHGGATLSPLRDLVIGRVATHHPE